LPEDAVQPAALQAPDLPSTDRPETDLLGLLRRDPARGLPAVLGAYEGPLLRHAAAVVSDASAAQDVVQDALLRLLACTRPIDDLSAWLHRVTHNLAIDHLRKESRLRKLHLAAAPPSEPLAPPPDADLDRQEARARIAAELERLTPNERAVLLLKIKEGRSYREISERTGLSASNVGYLVHQGLKKLTARLGQPERKGVAS
jgi:RNA polymerase sigma factor (sigma-70 family)